MISDYCCGDQEHSQRFKDYVASRDYKLYTVKEYGKIIERSGFNNVSLTINRKSCLNVSPRWWPWTRPT